MQFFDMMHEMGHEEVVWCRHPESGLRAIIAIHDTTLGPSLGGCRLMDYATEDEAMIDCLRLSRGMTYKSAMAGLDLGGGKAVILASPKQKSEAMFRAFGRFVHGLSGRYITAEDMNTTSREMEWIHRETPYVTGMPQSIGGSGDPGHVTAWGVFHGIKASLRKVYGSDDPRGRKVAIQGIGSVGYALSRYLHEAGARLVFADVNPRNIARAVEAFGGEVVDGDTVYDVDADVLAPCAIGAVINPTTIPRLVVPIVAGAANNQLEDEVRDAEALSERGIVYAPDYVINAGGLINVFGELRKWPEQKALDDTTRIAETVTHVLEVSDEQGITTVAAANRIAEERLAAVRSVNRVHRGG